MMLFDIPKKPREARKTIKWPHGVRWRVDVKPSEDKHIKLVMASIAEGGSCFMYAERKLKGWDLELEGVRTWHCETDESFTSANVKASVEALCASNEYFTDIAKEHVNNA